MSQIRSLPLLPVQSTGHLAVWNRRLLIAAATLILFGATMLALHAAGPEARAMIAGEGTVITGSL